MIDVLVSGVLKDAAIPRTTRTGGTFATCTIKASMRLPPRDYQGEVPPVLYVSCICFEADAVRALLALSAGDSVSVSGEASLKIYHPATGEPRPQLEILVHAVVSAYHVQRKRQVMKVEPQGSTAQQSAAAAQRTQPEAAGAWKEAQAEGAGAPFDDELPQARLLK